MNGLTKETNRLLHGLHFTRVTYVRNDYRHPCFQPAPTLETHQTVSGSLFELLPKQIMILQIRCTDALLLSDIRKSVIETPAQLLIL